MFEQATRQKFRFSTPKGEFTVEQLWDVPLRSRDDFNLDHIARGVNRQLEEVSEESFVDSAKKNPAKKVLELKLEILKRVIAVKVEDEEATEQRAANKIEREKLLRILAEKQEGKLSDLTEKELQKRIHALSE